MEARVAVLETHVEHIREDLAKLSAVPTELAVVKTKIEALPTKDDLTLRLMLLLAAVAALVAFGEKIQALLR